MMTWDEFKDALVREGMTEEEAADYDQWHETNEDSMTTRYIVEFYNPSAAKVGRVEVDAENSAEACRKVRRETPVKIDITLVRPIGRGGQA